MDQGGSSIDFCIIELIFKKKNHSAMNISWPFDAIHKTHIHVDTSTGELTLGKAPDWEICKINHLHILFLLKTPHSWTWK